MSFFNRTPARALGIDIGTTGIKAVEIAQSQGGLLLTQYGILETANTLDRFSNPIQSSNLKPLESDLSAYLKALVKTAGFQAKKVYASVPSFVGQTALIELPEGHATEGALSQAVSSYIPLPLTALTLQYVASREKKYPDGTTRKQVLVVMIPNERIETYHTIFAEAGLALEGVELEQQSVCRAFTTATAEPTLVIDIGGRSTSIGVAQAGELCFAGQTDFSSGSLTLALASALNISERRADQLKRQTLIVGKGGDHELSTIMIPIIDAIITEAKRIQTGFEKGYSVPVKNVIITGSGAHMPGFEKYLSEQLNMPVMTGNALSAVAYPPELEPIAHQLGSTLSVACGLALKQFKASKK